MPEHYTKDTVQAAAYCKPCCKQTMHRIDDGRLGPCMECMAKREKEHADRKSRPEPKQANLFQAAVLPSPTEEQK